MSGWLRHRGVATALDLESVDTDQLIPARFMSTPRADGYGQFLLYDLRHTSDGTPDPEAPLNAVPDASVLVTRRNFGSGSSREAAVYALVDYGIKAVIAPSFGDIFASNAVNNGLLPARLQADVVEAMIQSMPRTGCAAAISLENCSVMVGGHEARFSLDPVWREKLMKGWDDIDLTLTEKSAIADFRDQYSRMQPWAFPTGERAG